MIETFAILTTAANDLVATLHDRMPVILHPTAFNLWLSHNMHDPAQLQPFYQPYPSEQLHSFKVSNLVNSPKFDSPVCIAQV